MNTPERNKRLDIVTFYSIIVISLLEVTIMKNMCLNKENQVVMANDLIKSKSCLSLNEIKLLRLTIMQIVKEDNDFYTYKISIMELAKLLDIPSTHLYSDVYDICRHLLQEVVEIGDGNPKHKWKIFQWCSSCSYNNGIITIKLHEDLQPYLIQLKDYYTQYVLEDIILLKTIYAIRIYELIREAMKGQKVYADKIAIITLSEETIRKATGTEDKYTKMSMFRARVIDAALKEINAKLGYNISYEPLKCSRKIVGFRFKIESKNNGK